MAGTRCNCASGARQMGRCAAVVDSTHRTAGALLLVLREVQRAHPMCCANHFVHTVNHFTSIITNTITVKGR